jgi:hypothetical protein
MANKSLLQVLGSMPCWGLKQGKFMVKPFQLLSVLVLTLLLSCAHKEESTSTSDPYIKLEEIRSADSMAWVKKENEISTAHLRAKPGFDTLKSDIKSILASKERIPWCFDS